MSCVVLRVKKLKGAGIVHVAAKHNLRRIEAEVARGGHIDASRTALNAVLRGGEMPEDVALQARAMMAAAGITKLRKDAVRALELVVSLPGDHAVNEREFFDASCEWIGKQFGGLDNVLSAVVHRDESAVHMHALVLPLLNGRMTGSDAVGAGPRFHAIRRDFCKEVAVPFGFDAYPDRLLGADKQRMAKDVIKELNSRGDASVRSPVWPAVRDLIERHPVPFVHALGLAMPATRQRRLRSSTSIFISKGKGSQRRDPKEA